MSVTAITLDELRAARERLYAGRAGRCSRPGAAAADHAGQGPLLYAEAEARLFHEQLSMLVLALDADELDLERAVPVVQFMLRRAANRLAGWSCWTRPGRWPSASPRR